MSSGGGKGGSTTSSVTIPDWIKEPAQRNLARAEQAAQVGYMPWYGPDVAAATPQQLSAMQASNTAAQAFGLAPRGQAFDPNSAARAGEFGTSQFDPNSVVRAGEFGTAQFDSGLPQARTFAGGVQGYSSAPLFEQALSELAAKNPSQVDKYNSLYNNQYLNQNPSTAPLYTNGLLNAATGGSSYEPSSGGYGGSPTSYTGWSDALAYNGQTNGAPVEYRGSDTGFGMGGIGDVNAGYTSADAEAMTSGWY